ncbi:hypothetical protein PVAG01_03943 [Phlyctema vagabunda]|uniref:Spt20-like SEP domain-containing protein n=1 Tax=Phlyctema vagabunda TaxID=108571 RepID=A0ABR4PMV3_9HELO
MAPSAAAVQSSSATSTKAKRPIPSGIQTNGINSSTSSPSPSMSAGRLPSASKQVNNPNGFGSSASAARSVNRLRRDPPGQALGRGQRNSSAGMRSASLAGDLAVGHVTQPPPYIQTDAYILKKFRGCQPSLIIHLHPTNFRFDQMEGSFSYRSPMRIMIDHLKERTIPHDLVEIFQQMNVRYYEGCMIVQIYDYKSIAPSEGSNNKVKEGATKTIPCSIHNYNPYLTPSPYVPYPTTETTPSKSKNISDSDDDKRSRTAEQKDKENMPAPAAPGDSSRNAKGSPKRPPVRTLVLHPTELSKQLEIGVKANTPQSGDVGRTDLNGPLSAIHPPSTPLSSVPPTPQASMAPPAKRQKRAAMELPTNDIHAFQSRTTVLTTAPLYLDTVDSAAQSADLLEALAHPSHSAKLPSPKTRKRTVAEMAADEAQAAEVERFMTLCDGRNSAIGVQGAPNPTDGDGSAGFATFERFKAIDNIKISLAEAKRAEKKEADRKRSQDQEREKLRQQAEAENKKKEEQVALQLRVTAQAEAHRRNLVAQNQQPPQGMPMQKTIQQGQHGHPQGNIGMVNGMQGQSQRFQQQQVSQAQASSPIVRNGTPQSHGHSSPVVNNMGTIPMQQSNSSMGGSPPRPGSVVNQSHPHMGGPISHPMTSQRSQQSHGGGTPHMPSATPHMQSTPISRAMSQTPRMSQGSPVPGQMAHGQMMPNGQGIPISQAQQVQHQQYMQRELMRRQQMQNMAANGQQGALQGAQHMMSNPAMQHQQQPNPLTNPQYAAQLAAMQQRAQMANNMQPNMQQNFQPAPGMVNAQHLQQQRLAQLHMQQAQNQQQQQQSPQNNMQAMFKGQVAMQAQAYFTTHMNNLRQNSPNAQPSDEAVRAIKQQCQMAAQKQVTMVFARKQQQMVAAAAAAQNGMHQNMNGMPNGMQNGMQNGMGMQQRPPGM